MRGASPMALRSQAGFSAAYNPQQWGPVSHTSPNSMSTGGEYRHAPQSSRVQALAPRPVGPDGREIHTVHGALADRIAEPVASPPPPYSPRRDPDSQGSPRRSANLVSPSDTTSTGTESSHYGTPVSAATTLSPDFNSRYLQGPSPVLRHQGTPQESPSGAAAPSFSSQRVRTGSKNHTDRILSSLTSRGKTTSVASPINAIDALQEHTTQLIAQAPEASPSHYAVRAPAARRAASTGAIGLMGSSSRSTSHSPIPVTWEAGMPLPPPPPGPPPASARSQSLSRHAESPSAGLAPTLPFRQRRPPMNGTALDAVPRTPADWKEGDDTQHQGPLSPRATSKGPSPLHIDTGSILYKRGSGADYPQTTTTTTPGHARRDSSTGGLFRSPAVRNRSNTKGIRERRSESRNGKGRAIEDFAVEPQSAVAPWSEDIRDVRPTDLILPAPRSAKERMQSKSTPRSGKRMQSLDGALHSAELNVTSGKAVSFASSHTTPQAESSRRQGFSYTPPFSPGREAASSSFPEVIPSPALPLKSPPSPSARRSIGPSKLSLMVPPGPEQRPISHLLHMPNSDDSMQIPLTPSTRVVQGPVADLLAPKSPKAFSGRAIERHRIFAEREAAAANDADRLDLFVQYMIAESTIRREQYAAVFEEEGIDVGDLVKGAFGHHSTDADSHERPQASSREDASRRTSIASSALVDSSSQASQGDVSAVSRTHESPSSATTNSSTQHRPESNWWKDYVPCLSPIASMSIVTGQDEMDSRGRAPSRWWEDESRSGDARQADAFNVLGRSKRESKYMGVARNSPALYENAQSSSTHNVHWEPQEISQQPLYGSDEYPPEKVGWHEEDPSAPPAPQYPPTPHSAPFTPDPRRLDISRLVTLPPPYPRHHPAVNNSHPNLTDVRDVVRSLNDKEEIEPIRESYRTQIHVKRQRADSWCKHQRSLHRQDIDFRIEHGEMSPEQYDMAEAELEVKINRSEKDVMQDDFDLFQNLVLTPLHSIFSERVSLATSSLGKLSSRLFSDAQSHSPNLPQEEGDEQPELLEKLTQLKWLFEARETLHRQIYDLLSERNERYKAIVLLPYQQSNSHDKRAEAETFFAKDAQERRLVFEQAVCTRAEAFLSVIENNVSRGVEVQLSAFWDIAPSLLAIIHKIPSNLEGFDIQIPADEYAENPSYHDHPLQYLYSLLGHAEKSSYQFIESQINLLCLLHEIRSHTLSARCRVEAPSGEEHQRREERRLTEDLKEKVGVVEGQWEEALGSDLTEARERVRGYLLEMGGWDDEED